MIVERVSDKALSGFERMRRGACCIAICTLLYLPVTARSEDTDARIEPLIGETGVLSESVLETFLSPAEFSDRRFVHQSKGDEALFALDASLGASSPVVELHPERITWPKIADLQLVIEGGPLSLHPLPGLTDEVLDRGFDVRWTLEALGQRFSSAPHFAARVIAAEIISAEDRKRLAEWTVPKAPPVCRADAFKDNPHCLLNIGFEVRAVALSPDGVRLSLAFGGLRPRIEVYDIRRRPMLLWQALFPKGSGGAVETAFSSDGEWVTALTGKGVMHRFDSLSGGKHLAVESSGLTAFAVPPGRIMAVAGKSGEVTLWYLADGTVARRIPSRDSRGAVDHLTASGNGEVIATLEYADQQSVIRVWAVKNRALLRQLEVDGRTVAAIALDEMGNTVFVSHETRGLLSASVHSKDGFAPVSGNAASHCKGRIEWIPKQGMLICSSREGLMQMDGRGAMKGLLKVNEASSDWVAAASAGGSRIAAAGGGRLLIWWTD